MMKNLLLLILIFGAACCAHAQGLSVANPRCEYRVDPLGMDISKPHLSWELKSGGKNIIQKAYRVLVSDDLAQLRNGTGNIWDSGTVNAASSIQVLYAGKQLLSAKKYYWKVMIWDNQGHSSAWSQPAFWQTGLLKPTDWMGAQWIAYQDMPDSDRILPGIAAAGAKKRSPGTDILPILRKSFSIAKPLKSASVFISGLGHFELDINGKKVGDHYMDAGWVNYQKEALYVSFDVTDNLLHGDNALGIWLGNGMYFTPAGRYRKLTVAYGYPKVIVRLLLQYKDGSVENIVTDKSWKAAPGPITFSAIYGGEDFDATLVPKGWNGPGFNDSKWTTALTVSGPPQLKAQSEQPIKIFEHFIPKKETQINTNIWVYDMGQNASGIPQITVSGKKGDTIKLIPAELLKADGTANQNATGKSYILKYILNGNGTETWQPRFTYYGFRYVQVEGGVPQGQPNPQNLPVIQSLIGLHTRNAATKTGEFSCSNELFNRTYTLIDWAIQSNMVSVLTDCPHREKLGWLEEDHLMGNSLQYNYDIAALSKKVINDMKEAQLPNGLIPEIAPEFTVFGEPFRDSPEWGSAGILFPWYVYQWYGDKQVLADNYEIMQRYVRYLDGKANDHLLMQGLGDWYDLGPAHPGVSQLTPKGLTATAIFYYDLNILSNIAQLLGKPAEAASYLKQAAVIKEAFNQHFFNAKTQQYGTGSQTANTMAVYMKLVEPRYKAAVVNNIITDLRLHNNSLTAGDIGYRYLLKVLQDEGRSDVIFDMNSRSDVPGYGYQLAKGATALTESWQALPSVSNNHFMLGHIMEWFYAGLAGIQPAEDAVAYHKIVIRPEPVGDVTSAKATYHSVYGDIISDWQKDAERFTLSVAIPPNTTAIIYLPAKQSAKIISNGKELQGVKFLNGRGIIAVGSGSYHFTVQ
jgi:alpha-L-rhamnosidase